MSRDYAAVFGVLLIGAKHSVLTAVTGADAASLVIILQIIAPANTGLVSPLISDDRATLVPHPIGEAEVIYPNVVEPGAYGRGCTQRRSPAAFAMGDDVIAGAEARPLQHISQNRCRTDEAIVEQIGMRQMPGAR